MTPFGKEALKPPFSATIGVKIEVMAMVQETNMETLILSIIEREETNAQTETDYRKPLVGFAELRYDGFRHLRETVGPHHLMPDDVLKGAQSMV
ncbi:MAG: hypothetical protein IMY83_02435, partial [Chloroflexi bacterium]|nr:hypothetical protein [Chloroflexota bacterium]